MLSSYRPLFEVPGARTFIIGGMTERVACGSTTSLITWPNVRPSARAASAWPTGTVLMPDRMVSAT